MGVTENFRFQKRKESVSKLKLFTNLIRNSAFNCKMKGKIDMISLAEASRRRSQHIVCLLVGYAVFFFVPHAFNLYHHHPDVESAKVTGAAATEVLTSSSSSCFDCTLCNIGEKNLFINVTYATAVFS